MHALCVYIERKSHVIKFAVNTRIGNSFQPVSSFFHWSWQLKNDLAVFTTSQLIWDLRLLSCENTV